MDTKTQHEVVDVLVRALSANRPRHSHPGRHPLGPWLRGLGCSQSTVSAASVEAYPHTPPVGPARFMKVSNA